MSAVFLARLQFAFTIMFHYLFPPLTVGLGVILVIVEWLYLKTGDSLYRETARFWVKIFGLIFALGVATGLVMEFEFGTNWSHYSRFVGDIFGSALAAEGIFAFFLEGGFLAILLFGWDKVSPRIHFLAALLVAAGAHFSAVWIVVANSWQQTPAGYRLIGTGPAQRAQITSFWQVVFNPSSMSRIAHVYMGAWQAGAFLVMSVSAYYLLKNRHVRFAQTSMKIALSVAAVASILQLVTGDSGARVAASLQPAKLAAFEGHFPKSAPAPLYLFGWVNSARETVRGVSIPRGLSLILYGDPNRPVTGLDAFPVNERPPVNLVFQSFHLMVAIGFALIALAFAGLFFWWRGSLFNHPPLLMLYVPSVLLPELANELGWFSAEAGRQPYIVYHLLRTAQGVSPNVSAGEIAASLALFAAVYALLFALFVFLMNEKIQHGPGPEAPEAREPAGRLA